MIVSFLKLKIYVVAVFTLFICAATLCNSVMAQKSKSKENSAPKICTGGVINSKVTFDNTFAKNFDANFGYYML
jgi:hypothetical protein